MVFVMKQLHIQSSRRNQMIDITDDIELFVQEKNVRDGFVIVYVPHTTAGVTINEGADPSVQQDLIETLKRLVPEDGSYHHSEGNSDAHIKASLLGSSVTVLIQNGSLLLGTWQHIFFYEGDGPRSRTVYLQLHQKK